MLVRVFSGFRFLQKETLIHSSSLLGVVTPNDACVINSFDWELSNNKPCTLILATPSANANALNHGNLRHRVYPRKEKLVLPSFWTMRKRFPVE